MKRIYTAVLTWFTGLDQQFRQFLTGVAMVAIAVLLT